MFKKGDMIVCVDASGCKNLSQGDIYKVDHFNPYSNAVVLNGMNVAYIADRFRLAEKNELPMRSNEALRLDDSYIKPSYYNAGEFDVIEFCLIHNIPFWAGNSIKYVFRAGKKEGNKEIQDLRKAIEYINRRIKFLEGE